MWRLGFRAVLGPSPRSCVDTTAAAEFPFRPGISQEELVVRGSVYISEAIFRSHSGADELYDTVERVANRQPEQGICHQRELNINAYSPLGGLTALTKLRKSDLAFGVNFSPTQINLTRVLELVELSGGTTPAFTEAIRLEFFSHHAKGQLKGQLDIAKNVRLSLRAYGIVGKDEQFTDFGVRLNSLAATPSELYGALAKHILLNLRGLDLLRAIAHLKATHQSTDLQAIARELETMGVHVPPSGVHISTMKLWLQEAQVINEDLIINELRLRELIGYGLEEIDRFEDMTPTTRAFVRALAALAPMGPIPSSKVREHASAMSHLEFDLKDLREQVLYPLRDQGLIEVIKSTGGRGAKAHLIKPTDKFRSEFIVPILDALSRSIGIPVVRLTRPLPDIVKDLQSPDKHMKGVALEMLTVHLCRLLGLQVTNWRRRARDTGGGEVDVIAEGTNYVFSRWQIQCKNTSTVSHDDIARELGVVGYTRSNVVMIITTGRFAKPARELAENEMRRTPANILLLDGSDLAAIVKDPPSIGGILRKHARNAMKLKALHRGD